MDRDQEIQAVHAAFRQYAELSKRVGIVGVALEILAAVAAVSSGVADWEIPKAAVLGSVVALFVAALIRQFAQVLASQSLRFRSESLRAYALSQSVAPTTLADVEMSPIPMVMQQWLIGSLPSNALDEYYEPTMPIGTARLQEAVCHSAFFTARLLRVQGWVLTAISVSLVLVTFFWLNEMVESASPSLPATQIDFLYSFVLGVLTLRAAETALSFHLGSSEAASVCKELLERGRPSEDSVRALTWRYDLVRAKGPPPPTYLYRVFGGRYRRGWNVARRMLHAQYPELAISATSSSARDPHAAPNARETPGPPVSVP